VARILVVDDERLLGESLRRALSNEFDVRTTTDASEALRWLTSGDWYDVVLCDVMMPTMTGVELRDRVHAARPDLAARIVFMTGGILWSHVRELLDAVPNTVIAKPFDLGALRELIRRRTASDPPPKRASRP
jgi:two-component system NtrC family sensor kinase